MIIKSKSELIDRKIEGDREVFIHMSDNREIIKQCAEERKNYDKMYKRGRFARKIASIPALVFFNHPEFHDDEKALRRWLQTDEGRMYRTDR